MCTHKDGLVDLRAADAPPLILLDRADLLTELRSLKSRTDAVDNQEQEWIAQLIKRLESLSVYSLCVSECQRTHTLLPSPRSASHGPFLSHAFQHSPLNTSPPFSAPQRVDSLRREAQEKVEKLQKAIEGLQEVKSSRPRFLKCCRSTVFST